MSSYTEKPVQDDRMSVKQIKQRLIIFLSVKKKRKKEVRQQKRGIKKHGQIVFWLTDKMTFEVCLALVQAIDTSSKGDN